MPQPYIEYRSPNSGNVRKMTVLDGQPYYQSTGDNSGMPGTWLPFVMLTGTKPLNYAALPDNYLRSFAVLRFLESTPEFYLIKLEINEDSRETSNSRLPLKKTLIASLRLGGGVFDDEVFDQAVLDETEKRLAQDTIVFAEKPIFTSEDADGANLWLIYQGAVIASNLMRSPSPSLFFDNNSQQRSLSEKLLPDTFKHDVDKPNIGKLCCTIL